MVYNRLIAYMTRTNEPIFINFVLSDRRKAKSYSRMLVVVLRRFFHVDKPAQIQALDGMRENQV